MSKPQPNWGEGTWVAVPLQDSGFVLALIVRSARTGILLCCLFGERFSVPPTLEDAVCLRPDDVVLTVRVRDRGLREGTWVALGELDEWDRSMWHMPVFARMQPEDGHAWIITYDETTLQELSERRVDPELPELDGLPRDGLYGHVAAEIAITKLVQSRETF